MPIRSQNPATWGTLLNKMNGTELLASVTATDDASLDFPDFFSSEYDHYILDFAKLRPATDDTALMLRVAESASTWKFGANDYAFLIGYQADGGSNVSLDNAQTEIRFGLAGGTNGWSNLATEAPSGQIHIYSPSNTANHKYVNANYSYTGAGTQHWHIQLHGKYVSANAITGCQLLMSSGNFTSGEANLYGVRKA